ncbi:MAG TPA: hypothetical protein VFV39_01850, partial [Limnobacter sp.]|nr:hypothetical protein [Limnobacter sp.]
CTIRLLFTESLAKPLQASFCAASRAAEKRDYAHLFLTCQTLLAENFYFFTSPEKLSPSADTSIKNKPLTRKEFFRTAKKKGPVSGA